MRPEAVVFLISVLLTGAVQAQQVDPWTVDRQASSPDVLVINTSSETMFTKVMALPSPPTPAEAQSGSSKAALANVYREFCGGTPWRSEKNDLQPGEALCLKAATNNVTYTVSGVRTETGALPASPTVVRVPKVPVPSLAFIRDTNDAMKKGTVCVSKTGVVLTHLTLAKKQLYVCRTAEGVLQGFYPVQYQLKYLMKFPASAAGEPLPIPATEAVTPGVYTVPGDEALKDLKLTIRRPVWHALAWILLGALSSTLGGLVLARLPVIAQLRADLRMEGVDPARPNALQTGVYRLNTTAAEVKRYLASWAFWMPPEDSERLVRALLDWRDLRTERGRLERFLKQIQERRAEFQTGEKKFPVVEKLEQVLAGNADLDLLRRTEATGARARGQALSPIDSGETRLVELQDSGRVLRTVQAAARLAEHLTFYSLSDTCPQSNNEESGNEKALNRACLALHRTLQSEVAWRDLTAAEFSAFYTDVEKLHSAVLSARDAVLADMPSSEKKTFVSSKKAMNAKGAPPASPTTLQRVAPLMLWSWASVLTAAAVGWLLASVTGLQTLYFTGDPWGDQSMDYAAAFTYGALTVVAAASIVTTAKVLLPVAWRGLGGTAPQPAGTVAKDTA